MKIHTLLSYEYSQNNNHDHYRYLVNQDGNLVLGFRHRLVIISPASAQILQEIPIQTSCNRLYGLVQLANGDYLVDTHGLYIVSPHRPIKSLRETDDEYERWLVTNETGSRIFYPRRVFQDPDRVTLVELFLDGTIKPIVTLRIEIYQLVSANGDLYFCGDDRKNYLIGRVILVPDQPAQLHILWMKPIEEVSQRPGGIAVSPFDQRVYYSTNTAIYEVETGECVYRRPVSLEYNMYFWISPGGQFIIPVRLFDHRYQDRSRSPRPIVCVLIGELEE